MSIQQHIDQLLGVATSTEGRDQQEWLALLDDWEEEQKALANLSPCIANTAKFKHYLPRPRHSQIYSITIPDHLMLGNHLVRPNPKVKMHPLLPQVLQHSPGLGST
jgi:hypothetical protein